MKLAACVARGFWRDLPQVVRRFSELPGQLASFRFAL
jgi:hypothetical protein